MTLPRYHEGIAQDVRDGLRQLRRAPVFGTVAVLMLTLGIGANVAIFTIVDGMLLRPLPYPNPEQLVEIDDVYEGRGSGVGQQEFREWSTAVDVFQRLALTEYDSAILRAPGSIDPERIVGERVSDGFFDVLGVRPLYGRTFMPGDDVPGRANVLVLSHGFWRRSFRGDPNAIGTSVTLGDTAHEIIGVMPPSFVWIEARRAEYWRPLGYRSSGYNQHQYGAVGRLTPASSVESAQARMDVFARRAEAQYPSAKGWSISVRPLGHAARRESRTPLLALTIAVALVLLIACANVASLLTVRTVSRSGEIAVRAAIGATRGRLVRQLLIEGAMLASIGGGLGVLLAHWLIRALAAGAATGIPLPAVAGLDARILAFAIALTAMTTILFAIVPARHTIRLDAIGAMKAGGAAATPGPARQRFLSQMVAGEAAFATVLLIAGTLLTVSVARLYARDLGFRPDRVLTFNLRIPSAYDAAGRLAFFRNAIERLGTLPGVESAAATSGLPMSDVYSGSGFDIDGRPSPAEWRQQSAQYIAVTSGYFETLRIGVVSGRSFAAREPAPVAVISETLARRHWPGGNPVGTRIGSARNNRWMTIVGVVADTRYGGPRRDPNPTIYLPHDAGAGMSSMFVAIRLRSTQAATLPVIRQALRELDSGAVVTRAATMEELTERSLTVERSLAALFGAFAVFAVVLAAIGSYGLIAYAVQQRTREMGIRLALGAAATNVRNMVLLQGIRASLLGIAAGVALALGVTRFLASLLFGVAARDPIVFVATPAVLVAVAVASVWLPARRASRVDPIVALRAE